MPTLAQVRTKVDDWLAAKWPSLVARQDTFFANNGRYWQGVRTHLIVPTFTTLLDGDSIPDLLTLKPTDVSTSWLDAFPDWLGVAIPCAIRCDVYKGPLGVGWVATVWVRYNGTLYTRSRNVGPEDYRTQAWSVARDDS